MIVETGIYYFADYVVTTDEDAPLFTWDLEIPPTFAIYAKCSTCSLLDIVGEQQQLHSIHASWHPTVQNQKCGRVRHGP
jgi:hypothetical protein